MYNTCLRRSHSILNTESFRRSGARHRGCFRPQLEPLEARQLLAANPLITEFMASNNDTLLDGDGQSSDWIEIHNAGDMPLDLMGHYLTDDAEELAKWPFPSVNLSPGEYLVVFASGQDRNDYIDASGGLHTNFRLAARGEYLALVAPDGSDVVSQYGTASANFEPQLTDMAYGLADDGTVGYLASASPGAPNNAASPFAGRVADTKFDVNRGLFDSPLDVTITSDTADAQIFYTIDGSVPAADNPAAKLYSDPVSINTTTTLRAVAMKSGFLPTNVDTQTYLFLNDVIRQPTRPDGFPETWNNYLKIPDGTPVPADYELDPRIVNDSVYAETIVDDLKSLPTLSLVMDHDDWFESSQGIYVNPLARGREWEREVSVEWIDPAGGDQFQVDAGIRVFGGFSRYFWDTPKKSFSLRFRKEYGPPRLDFPLFAEPGADAFDLIVLRAVFNDAWPQSLNTAQYLRDMFARQTQLQMGQPASRGTWVNLYINGLYWGIYNPSERPDADFAASHFGGDPSDYDTVKHVGLSATGQSFQNAFEAAAGDSVAWEQALALAGAGLEDAANYEQFKPLVDIENLADYMILNQYLVNTDWPQRNWWASRKREPGAGFRFYAWDSEHTLRVINGDRMRVNNANTPAELYAAARENREFRVTFADRVHKHLFNNGVLQPDANIARYAALAEEIESAIVAESARWGDNGDTFRGETFFTKNDDWLPTRNSIVDSETGFFALRHDIALDQFRALDLYPNVTAPTFNQHGGVVQPDFQLSMDGPGDIYFTTDGSDPRAADPTRASTTLLDEGVPATALVPSDDSLGQDWTAIEFNDDSWTSGITGVGLDLQPTFRPLIGLDIESAMYQVNGSAYIRVPFEVADPSSLALAKLFLRMKYEDGYVAYLNGTEVARRNAPDKLAWDSNATRLRIDNAALRFEDAEISEFIHLLQPGMNVLAIHGLNSSVVSNDFVIMPQVVGQSVVDAGISSTATQFSQPILFSEDTVVKARAMVHGEWTALNEAPFSRTIIANGPIAASLRVAEVHYNPAAPTAEEIAASHDDKDDFEFIELVNIGRATIDLSSVKLVQVDAGDNPAGVAFDFSSSSVTQLEPGGRVLVVENMAAFQVRYGGGLPVAGQWSGGLNNGGEMISMTANDVTVQQFIYDDAWYPETDGGGASLEIVDATSLDLNRWNQQDVWRPSAQQNGTPGFSPTSVAGDFDGDQLVGASDIDLLYADVRAGTHSEARDLNSDGIVDPADVDELVLNILGTRYGDTDLDGDVDQSDFEILAAHFGASGSTWSDGNFDGDDRVAFADFVRLSNNFGFTGKDGQSSDLLITELMASNQGTLMDADGNSPDWIEVYNKGTAAIDLQDWYLSDEDQNLTRWRFPRIELGAGQFLVVFASAKDTVDEAGNLHTNFKLAKNGEFLALVQPDGTTIAAQFAPQFPAQFTDVSYGVTMRVSPEVVLDDQVGYFDIPTPGMPNPTVFSLGPAITNVQHTPNVPQRTESVVVTAEINQQLEAVADVSLTYRVMYGDEVMVSMTDDGTGADQTAADGIYTAVIPADVAAPGEMLRYYIVASNRAGSSMRAPRVLDTTGTDRSPEYFGTVVDDPSRVDEFPVFQWFEETEDGTPRNGRGSVFYQGEFYDNISYSRRGGATNGRDSQEFNFNEDHPFFVNDKLGRVQEINLNAEGADPSFVRQTLAFEWFSLAGVPSPESFLVPIYLNGNFRRVGVFIEQVDEDFLDRNGLDPEGALYKFNGSPINALSDETIICAKASEDEMQVECSVEGVAGVVKKTRLDEGFSDLAKFINGLNQPTPKAKRDFVFDHFNMAELINYLAVRSLTRDSDDTQKNFYLYRDTNGNGQWHIFPWDKDLTMSFQKGRPHPFIGSQQVTSGTWNALYDFVFSDPLTREMYLRRLRSLMDEVLQPPDTPPDQLRNETRVEELFRPAAPHLDNEVTSELEKVKAFFAIRRQELYVTHGIDQLPDPGSQLRTLIPEFVEGVRYFVPSDNSLGDSWTGVEDPINIDDWETGQTGVGFEITKGNRAPKYADIINSEVRPGDVCSECSSIYVRIPFAVDNLAEITDLTLRMKFGDGYVAYLNGVEVARNWVLDEPAFDSTTPTGRAVVEFQNTVISRHLGLLNEGDQNVLAIHSVNSRATDRDQFVLPELVSGVIGDEDAAGIPHAQVARPAIEFGAFDADPSSGNQDEEFLELKNPLEVAVDISGWSLAGGIRHTFQPGTVIPAGSSLFASPNVNAFRARTAAPTGGRGLLVQGDYQGHLSSRGESVQLLAPDGTLLLHLEV